MPSDALSRFAETIIKQANDIKNQNIQNAAKRSKDKFNAQRAEIKQRSNDEMRAALSKIKSEVSRRAAAAEEEYKTNLLKRRNQICDEVFGEAKKRLEEFTGSADYADWFSRTLSDAFSEINAADAVCTVLPRDRALAESFGARFDVKTTNNDIIGGFTLESRSMKLFCDCTLSAELERQKERFYTESGLTVGD